MFPDNTVMFDSFDSKLRTTSLSTEMESTGFETTRSDLPKMGGKLKSENFAIEKGIVQFTVPSQLPFKRLTFFGTPSTLIQKIWRP